MTLSEEVVTGSTGSVTSVDERESGVEVDSVIKSVDDMIAGVDSVKSGATDVDVSALYDDFMSVIATVDKLAADADNVFKLPVGSEGDEVVISTDLATLVLCADGKKASVVCPSGSVTSAMKKSGEITLVPTSISGGLDGLGKHMRDKFENKFRLGFAPSDGIAGMFVRICTAINYSRKIGEAKSTRQLMSHIAEMPEFPSMVKLAEQVLDKDGLSPEKIAVGRRTLCSSYSSVAGSSGISSGSRKSVPPLVKKVSQESDGSVKVVGVEEALVNHIINLVLVQGVSVHRCQFESIAEHLTSVLSSATVDELLALASDKNDRLNLMRGWNRSRRDDVSRFPSEFIRALRGNFRSSGFNDDRRDSSRDGDREQRGGATSGGKGSYQRGGRGGGRLFGR